MKTGLPTVNLPCSTESRVISSSPRASTVTPGNGSRLLVTWAVRSCIVHCNSSNTGLNTVCQTKQSVDLPFTSSFLKKTQLLLSYVLKRLLHLISHANNQVLISPCS